MDKLRGSRDLVSDAAQPPADAGRDRLIDIDRAKGVAIALVVWGHIASFAPAGSPIWFYISIEVIYSFHMPLFMYLSGFVFFYAGLHERFWQSPSRQIVNRFDRLMVPFFFFGFLVVVGKYFTEMVAATPDPVYSIEDGIWKVITNTTDNPAISLWYLFVIFVYAIFTPILWRLGGGKFFFLFAVAAIGWIFTIPEQFYLARIAKYFIFFSIGGFVASKAAIALRMFENYGLLFLAIFILLCASFFTHPLALIICGISSIPAVHGLVRKNILKNDRILKTIGQNSMAIYLMNSLFIGVFGIALLTLGLTSWGLFIPLFVVGIIGPMLVRMAFDNFYVLKPIARYLS